MLSISFNSALEKLRLDKALKASSTCATLLAPMSTEVTRSSRSSHATAISASFCPRCCARSFNLLIADNFACVSCSGLSDGFLLALDSVGIPCSYLSVNIPCASGEKAIQPTLWSSSTSSNPFSGVRSNMEYLG